MPHIKLSILVPVYNEAKSIAGVLDRIWMAPAQDFEQMNISPEVILVDDGSLDQSGSVIEQYIERHARQPIRLLRHTRNRGKGAALRTALSAARGELCIIQDVDFEYDPGEYGKLLRPLLAEEADIVFGTRFAANREHQASRFWYSTANRLLTKLCGMAAHWELSDALTCYKAFRTVIAQGIPLRSERFGIEVELTIKFAKRGAHF